MAPARFVIGYDIADPRRLQRVRRIMCRYAAPLEYSVFFLVGSAADKDRCLREIGRLIDPAQDDVRFGRKTRRRPCRAAVRDLPALRRGQLQRRLWVGRMVARLAIRFIPGGHVAVFDRPGRSVARLSVRFGLAPAV